MSKILTEFHDRTLYQELSNKFQIPARKDHLIDDIEGRKIRLAADIICGRKQIVKFHENDYEKWREDYELVRSNLNLHFCGLTQGANNQYFSLH